MAKNNEFRFNVTEKEYVTRGVLENSRCINYPIVIPGLFGGNFKEALNYCYQLSMVVHMLSIELCEKNNEAQRVTLLDPKYRELMFQLHKGVFEAAKKYAEDDSLS